MADPISAPTQRVVCGIGDIHGYMDKLQNLWSNLEIAVGPSDFNTALIIFLGDYCDRGPDTQKVIDFLISLPATYSNQTHVFLCGNHDLAFAAFLGVLPSPPDGSPFSETWKEYEMSEEREGWYKGDGYENMHLQGRRWAGRMVGFNHAKKTEYKGSIYDAGPTFESYGVPHGSADLMKAVPEEHKKFLADLVWVHEEDNVYIQTEHRLENCKLIAVHAGLEKGTRVVEQLNHLKSKDTRIPKVEALSGRKNVWNIPEELTRIPTIVISGHHAKVHIEDFRLIIDEGGGVETNPVAAIVLPSKKLVRDTDKLGLAEALKEKDEMSSILSEKEKTEIMEKAHSAIILSLGDKALREVARETTATTMWLKLENLYMTKSLANRLYMKQRLYSFKIAEEKNLSDQIDEFVAILEQSGKY